MRLIGLAGKARSGKDTVADMLAARGFERYAFAQPLKQGVRAMFGLTEAHTDGEWKEDVLPWLGRSPRYLMQTLGTEWGRQLVAEDVWLRLAQKRLDDMREDAVCTFGRCRGLVISDVRFDNEAEWVRDQGGEVWHIARPEAQAVADHASEAGVFYDPCRDQEIYNASSLSDLERAVGAMLGREAA